MEALFDPQFKYLWATVLALALFLPVRNLIHTLYVRRAQKQTGEVGEEEIQRLKKRAGITAALLCFVFAFLYTAQIMQG